MKISTKNARTPLVMAAAMLGVALVAGVEVASAASVGAGSGAGAPAAQGGSCQTRIEESYAGDWG